MRNNGSRTAGLVPVLMAVSRDETVVDSRTVVETACVSAWRLGSATFVGARLLLMRSAGSFSGKEMCPTSTPLLGKTGKKCVETRSYKDQ